MRKLMYGILTIVSIGIFSGCPLISIVPNVVGLSQSIAETNILSSNLTIGEVTFQTSATVPLGVVISQNPIGGTIVDLNAPVKLVISSGSEGEGEGEGDPGEGEGEQPETYVLIVQVDGNGTVVASPDQTEYEGGAVVTLTATPNTENVFDHWTGNVTNIATVQTTITMNANESVIAHFVAENAEGEGEGEEEIDLLVDNFYVMDEGFTDPNTDDFFAHINTVGGIVSNSFQIQWFINGVLYHTDTITATSDNWMYGLEWPEATPGDHNLRLVIDSQNEIEEDDETNNEYELEFTVPSSGEGEGEGEDEDLVKQPLHQFTYPDDSGDMMYFTVMQTDAGVISGGPSAFSTQLDGALHLITKTINYATSYAGKWISTTGTANDRQLLLDPEATLPWPIKEDYQVKIKSWYAFVKGQGDWKVELKSGPQNNEVLVERWTVPNLDEDDYVEVRRAIPQETQSFKLLNLIAETNSDLLFDEIGFYVKIPEISELRYAFLASAAQALRCYSIDVESGMYLVKDRVNWPIGDFDNTPGLGFVSLISACGYALDMINIEDAKILVTECIQSLLAMPVHESGFFPHWTKSINGQVVRHPESEISTEDTALALVSMYLACNILEMDAEKVQILDKIRSLDFKAVANENNEISHGFDLTDSLIPYSWNEWGGETQLILLLTKLNDLSKTYSYQTVPPSPPASPVNGGTGFIAEMAGLLFANFGGEDIGPDGYGVNWYQQRLNVLADQTGLLNTPIFVGGHSAVEIISADGYTTYHVGQTNPVHTGEEGYGFPWIAPHYAAMISSLDTTAAKSRVEYMVENELMYPLCGPAESVLLDTSDWSVIRWNPMQGVLNAFFSAIGYYHAVVIEEGLQDKIYLANESDADLKEAIESLFAGPPKPRTLQAEAGYGSGSIKQRSNAQGLHTVWLQSGQTRSINFTTTASSDMTMIVRYSNDNYGSREEIDIAVDSILVGSFTAQDTGNYGNGWNIFVQSELLGPATLNGGNHTITVTARAGIGDGYGVEIDSVNLNFAK